MKCFFCKCLLFARLGWDSLHGLPSTVSNFDITQVFLCDRSNFKPWVCVELDIGVPWVCKRFCLTNWNCWETWTSHKRVEFDGHPDSLRKWKMDCWGSYEQVAVVLLRNTIAWGHQPTLCCRKNSFLSAECQEATHWMLKSVLCPFCCFEIPDISPAVRWLSIWQGVFLSKP